MVVLKKEGVVCSPCLFFIHLEPCLHNRRKKSHRAISLKLKKKNLSGTFRAWSFYITWTMNRDSSINFLPLCLNVSEQHNGFIFLRMRRLPQHSKSADAFRKPDQRRVWTPSPQEPPPLSHGSTRKTPEVRAPATSAWNDISITWKITLFIQN